VTIDLVPSVIVAYVAVVVVPLAVRVVDERDRAGHRPRLLVALRACTLPAAAVLCSSIAIEPGPVAAALAAPWMLVCAALALYGAGRVVRRGLAPVAELAIDAGFVFIAVGGMWTVAWRAGGSFMGFAPLWVLLTAAHFHVAGFALPIAAGMIARLRPGGVSAACALAVITGVPLTAVGIASSRTIEVAAGLVLSLGALGVGALWIASAGRRGRGVGRVLSVVAGASLLASMPLAINYALGRGELFRLAGLTGIETMAVTHGALNALGFATAVMVSLCVRPIASRATEGGMPVSRLASSGRVGADYFARRGLDRTAQIDPQRRPRGLVDRLEQLEHPGFDAGGVAPAIRAFYEDTAGHVLFVRPDWRRGFRLGARLFTAIARRVEQLGLPLRAEREDDRIASTIVAIDDAADGRPGARAWVRTYADTGRAMYVAAYATHVHRRVAYMNIAFPLPWSNLASILRADPIERGRGLVLTTVNPPGEPGDAGIWWVLQLAGRSWRVRLPLRETIHVWTPDMPSAPRDLVARAPAGTTSLARHQLWLFGIHYLTLDYTMAPA
jgi:hypothetical protein